MVSVRNFIIEIPNILFTLHILPRILHMIFYADKQGDGQFKKFTRIYFRNSTQIAKIMKI